MEVRRRNKPGQGRKKDQENIEKRRALGYGDTMSPEEVDEIITRAGDLDFMGLCGEAWACLFAIFWAYGKRISEVVELRTTDLAIRGNDLTVTFTVRKKVRHSKNGIIIPKEEWDTSPRRTKRLTLDNKYTQIIRSYWDFIKERGGGFLFPRPTTKMGYIYPKYVWDAIRKMEFEQPIWTHLFRHSLATELAQNEVGAFEMKSWFDWEHINMADTYVLAAGVSTKKVSSRKW